MPAASSVDVLVTQGATRIISKLGNFDLAKVDLGKLHRRAVLRRLCRVISGVDEHTHPLITSAMSINGAALFACRLYLNAVSAGGGRVVGVSSLNLSLIHI